MGFQIVPGHVPSIRGALGLRRPAIVPGSKLTPQGLYAGVMAAKAGVQLAEGLGVPGLLGRGAQAVGGLFQDGAQQQDAQPQQRPPVMAQPNQIDLPPPSLKEQASFAKVQEQIRKSQEQEGYLQRGREAEQAFAPPPNQRFFAAIDAINSAQTPEALDAAMGEYAQARAGALQGPVIGQTPFGRVEMGTGQWAGQGLDIPQVTAGVGARVAPQRQQPQPRQMAAGPAAQAPAPAPPSGQAPQPSEAAPAAAPATWRGIRSSAMAAAARGDREGIAKAIEAVAELDLSDVEPLTFGELWSDKRIRTRLMGELKSIKVSADDSWRDRWLAIQEAQVGIRRGAEKRRGRAVTVSETRAAQSERKLKLDEAMAPVRKSLAEGKLTAQEFKNATLEKLQELGFPAEQVRRLKSASAAAYASAARNKYLSGQLAHTRAMKRATAGRTQINVGRQAARQEKRIDTINKEIREVSGKLKAAAGRAGIQIPEDIMSLSYRKSLEVIARLEAMKATAGPEVARFTEQLKLAIEDKERMRLKEGAGAAAPQKPPLAAAGTLGDLFGRP